MEGWKRGGEMMQRQEREREGGKEGIKRQFQERECGVEALAYTAVLKRV